MTFTKLPKAISAEELLSTPLPPVKWIIPGLLPAGLALFAGPSKAGKSWLTLWLCLQIAQGNPVWNREIEPRTVVYFSLEDTFNRLQNRIFQLIDGGDAPERLILQTECPSIGQGLEEQVESLIHTYRDVGLIVIDTLQKVRVSDGNGGMYANDYKEAGALKKIADKYGICILLIHHLRKQTVSDPFDQISGSTGLMGVADTSWVMQRKRMSQTADILLTGRDMDDRTLHLREENCIWTLEDEETAEEREIKAVPDYLWKAAEYIESIGNWQGTASELLAAAGIENAKPNQFTYNMAKYFDKVFEPKNIRYKTHRKNKVRLLSFYGDDGDGGDDDIDISRGYDYEGNRLKSVQKTVKPPKEYTPKQAEKWVKEQAILFEREVQHSPEPINRSITLAKYIEHWVSNIGPKKLADSTYQRDLQDIRRILPALGNYKLTDLRKEVIREFYEEMRRSPRLDGRGNLSEKSVEGLHNTLCGILSAAVDEGYLTHNPAWRCYKPKGQKKERPVADEETVKKLITAFEGQRMKYETYFKLVLATGLRRGEACGLKWSDINWRKRTIHVQRGVVKLSHQESITKDPKTSSGDRMVYLSKEMCQLLKAWRKECEWDREQTANETVDEEDYLFRQPNGKPMCPSTFTYRFKLILKANNLPLDLSVHSLRHTNASLLISQGVDVRTVASLLGHAQASTTLDIYAHAFDKNKRKAQEKLGKAIGL